MTEVRVRVGGWEHQCCGDAIEPGVVVHWRVIPADGGFVETRHDDVPGERALSGRVRKIAALQDDGPEILIRRVPSGRALRGFDERDDGAVQTIDGAPLDVGIEEFVVTLEVGGPGDIRGARR